MKNDDMIELDVAKRRLCLEVSDEELAERKKSGQPPKPEYSRGYYKLYRDHVMQVNTGADFDFLVGNSGAKIGKDSH